MHRILKLFVAPKHLTVLVQQSVGQFQLTKQGSLNLSVFRCKADQFVHDQCLTVAHHNQHNRKIYQRIETQYQSHSVVQKVGGHIDTDEQKTKI